MTARILVFASLLPLSALAQLQVFQFDGTNYTPVGAVANVGSASPGDTLRTRFRVRNMGNGPAILQTLSLSGEGFSIQSAPSIPYTLAPYAGPPSEAEIDVAFSPTFPASYSATLAINGTDIVLQGNAAASVSLMLAGSNTPLAAGVAVNFGSVAVGSSKTQSFVLSNGGTTSLTVGTLKVSGADFSQPQRTCRRPCNWAPGKRLRFR